MLVSSACRIGPVTACIARSTLRQPGEGYAKGRGYKETTARLVKFIVPHPPPPPNEILGTPLVTARFSCFDHVTDEQNDQRRRQSRVGIVQILRCREHAVAKSDTIKVINGHLPPKNAMFMFIMAVQWFHPWYRLTVVAYSLILTRYLLLCDNVLFWRLCFLRSPYEIGKAIIFLQCVFFLLSFFLLFCSPNSGRRLDVYHTSTHGVALVRI